MGQARKNGSNRFHFYTQAMNDEIAQRLLIETGLQKALSQQEFYLHYQPLVEWHPSMSRLCRKFETVQYTLGLEG